MRQNRFSYGGGVHHSFIQQDFTMTRLGQHGSAVASLVEHGVDRVAWSQYFGAQWYCIALQSCRVSAAVPTLMVVEHCLHDRGGVTGFPQDFRAVPRVLADDSTFLKCQGLPFVQDFPWNVQLADIM